MMNAKQATFAVLDGLSEETKFSGRVLAAATQIRSGRNEYHYPDTYLRYMREYRQKTGRKIVCVNKRKSLYKIL